MPNFDETTWYAFKQQFLSVFQWLLWCFDKIFDTLISHPMLYAFAFFSIFSLSFILILNFVTNIVPFKGLLESSDVNTDNSLFKNYSATNNREVKSKNLAAYTSKDSRGSFIKENQHGNIKSNRVGSLNQNSYGNIKSHSFNSVVDSNAISSANGHGKHGFDIGIKAGKDAFNEFAKLIKDSKLRKQQDLETYEKIAAEQESLAAKHQYDEDKRYNMETHLSFSTDDEGNPVTTRTVVNTRTGEVVSSGDTVRHVNQ